MQIPKYVYNISIKIKQLSKHNNINKKINYTNNNIIKHLLI